MLYSTSTFGLASVFGTEQAVRNLIDTGFPAIDLSLYPTVNEFIFEPSWRDTAERLLSMAKARNVVFNQAHAPFGGGYERYTKTIVPQLPRIFDFCGAVGVKNVVVHPLQPCRYYGHEQEIFDLNVDFYRSIAPYAKNSGVKIAIENMWQNHPVTKDIVDDICADPYELADMFDTLDDDIVFTCCLDVGHVALCGREPQDAIRILGKDRLGALHVHDVDYKKDLHTLPYLGKINWDEVCLALAETGYEGELTLEADKFIQEFDTSFKPIAVKFTRDMARHLATKISAMKEK